MTTTKTIHRPGNMRFTITIFLSLITDCFVFGIHNCANNRKIFTSSAGVVSDGSANYPEKSKCEWLIRAPYKNQSISIRFTEFETECSFDFLYVFDGASYHSPLLGSFTGKALPDEIISSSSEVLILLFSDNFKARKGFSLTYEATDCPRKCSGDGTCHSGKCTCNANFKGEYCQLAWCPKLCYESSAKGKCSTSEKRCKCNPGYFGESCSLSSAPNSDSNAWHKISPQSTVFKPRSKHVAAYIKESNSLWVHGGKSFSKVFDDILMFNITSNVWHNFPAITFKPVARFQHAGDVYLHYLVIFGGERAEGTKLDDLWMFDTILKTWSQPPGHDINKPTAVAGHTANIIGSNLYVFGGRTEYGGFSTDIFKFNLNESTGWKKLSALGVRPSFLKLVGHSTVYNRHTNSLLVFGGELAWCSRNESAPQQRLLSFNLDNQMWTELNAAKSSSTSQRSFHSAVVVGDYMVIYGGLLWTTHQTCQLTDLLYYNMRCNTWVPESSIRTKSPASTLSEPPSKGRYSHVAMMWDYQTMFIVGGYNGAMVGDIMAYRFPKTVVFKNSSGEVERGWQCTSYTDSNACQDDPACGWCTDNSKCYASQNSHKCTGKLQVSSCRGHCSAYPSCTSCLLFGNTSTDACSWCVHDQKCYQRNSPGGRCSPDTSRLQIGWWGSTSRLLTAVNQCMTEDSPPGMTLIEFKRPGNRSFPDGVSLVRTSHINGQNNDDYMRGYELKGFVYPYALEVNPTDSKKRDVFVSGIPGVDCMLYISQDQLATSKTKVASIAFSNDRKTAQAKLPSNADLFPTYSKNAKFYMEFEVNLTKKIPFTAQISWNVTSSSAVAREAINASFLQPYIDGNCRDYPTCMACMTDSGCGWCSANSTCIAKSSWYECLDSSAKPSYLVLNPLQCFQCSNYHDCKSCAKDSYCSWTETKDVGCFRAGLHSNEITSDSNCSAACANRSGCSSCLADSKCRWCAGKQKCFSASNQMIEYSMGECLEYQVRDTTLKDLTCRNCSRHMTCSACFADHRCGWCGNVDNPLIGLCREGDYSGPRGNGNCSVFMKTNETVTWSYEKCPDVDECKLNIHRCDSNATCYNTYQGYNCNCNRGYTGDGKIKCHKTCDHVCQHGSCGPDYKCKCDLGWRGVNCSTDCGCNGHSTCNSGIGVCDLCQENTQGKYCQECKEGTAGNATTTAGCKPCLCNQHEDKDQGFCDRNTGKCFCKDGTTGDYCEKCEKGLEGDPRNGGACYHGCSRFTAIKNVTPGSISFTPPQSNCLWVVSAANASNYDMMHSTEKPQNTSVITINFSLLKLPCKHSHVYIYDGVLQESASAPDFKLLASVCGYNVKAIKTIATSTGRLTVLFKGPSLNSKLNTGTFVASFNVYDCPHRCSGHRVCKSDGNDGMRCVCEPGWAGAACDTELCPKNCSNGTGQGYCDVASSKCICLPGFIGEDCSETVSNKKFSVTRFVSGSAQQPKPRYGHTLLYHAETNMLLMFAGRGMNTVLFSDVWSFQLENHIYTNLSVSNQPKERYFHCGVIYKSKMIIYGGLTNIGVSHDILSYDVRKRNWTLMRPSQWLPPLYGHSCTLVGNSMFVIGGYSREDGLNEFSIKINLDTLSWLRLKTNGFAPSGVYAHTAVYDQSRNNIFIFGGIAFYKEKVQESDRTYSLDIGTLTWNYIKPLPQHAPFPLFLHSAAVLDDVVYITGGYSSADSRGFNGDVLIWKMKCDQWMKVSIKDRKYAQGGKPTPIGVGSSIVSANKSLILYAGYDGQLSGNLWIVKPPKDLCSLLDNQSECLDSVGCAWCLSTFSPNNGTCYSTDANIPFPCNSTSASNTTVYASSKIFPGISCTAAAISKKPCSTYDTCVSCLATFPGQPGSHCHWCSPQGCRSLSEACSAGNYDFRLFALCLEPGCEASSCENCGGGGTCFWTRHYLYTGEKRRLFDKKRRYDWNCFRKSLEVVTNGNVTDKAPPNNCPQKCVSFTSCKTCLASEGAEGGSQECLWSQKLSRCLPLSWKYVSCISGDCGSLYTKASGCPATCEGVAPCEQCLRRPECGWCAQPGVLGKGICRASGLERPKTGACSKSGPKTSNSSIYSVWTPALCPLENECLNGRHNCKVAEDCIDLEQGFTCRCRTGYRLNSSTNQCEPVCQFGCVNGRCLEPDVCKCNFGWTSRNCSVSCKCNGHSDCPDAAHSDVCLLCHNNTQGASCNECLPGFVGDPASNVSCSPCILSCNNRASLCISSSEFASLSDQFKRNETWLRLNVKRGPKSVAGSVCVNCKGNSKGIRCEECLDGFFERNKICTTCLCNGHAATCDNTTGEGCKCQQNTETGDCTKEDCWQKQCSKCKKNFMGDPKNSRQCFQRMSTSQMITLGTEIHSFGKESTIKPLAPNRVLFFAIPPQFTNVNIRLLVDIFQGMVDLFITTENTIYTVDLDFVTGNQTLKFVKKPARKTRSILQDKLPIITMLGSGENSRERRAVAEPDVAFDKTDTGESAPLSLYTEYKQGLFMLKNLQRRAIIGISYKDQDFSKNRFYIGVVTRGNEKSRLTGGVAYFRQDLPQIELFVFFSVFFSVFFLILSLFFIMWKVSQLHHGHRAVIAHQMELDTMASRPFSSYSVKCEPNEPMGIYRNSHEKLLEASSGRRKERKSYTLAPMAIESTEDELAAVVSVFVQFPENEESLWNLAVCSAIVQTSPQQLVVTEVRCMGQGDSKSTTRYMSTVNV